MSRSPANESEFQSLARLRETIIRKIMRVACFLGVCGIAAGALFVRPFETLGAVIGAIATIAVFGATLLPPQVPIVSTIYPWALVLTGTGLAWVLGPKPEPFLLTAGGLFIGSLLFDTRQHVALAVVAVVGGFAALFWSMKPFMPGIEAAWINSATSMASVVLPAAIAGRMIVGALSRAMARHEALVLRLVEESTAREHALRILEKTQTQLTHAQKMELLGQMAGGIAHDMNNALTSVMGEASLLSDTVAEERERILEATTYAAKLTHQLMIFSRRDITQPRPMDLSTAMRSMVKAIRRVIPSEIRLVSDLPGSPVVVVVDPTQLLQVLLNLAANAKDAMETGGQLTIALRANPNERTAIIEAQDTGCGIAPDILPHIFEPFFTTKPAGVGTGLGLANVKQHVEAMGGNIEVHSTLDVGTRFIIRFPVTDAPAVSDTEPKLPPLARTGRVLVVDDDVRVRAVVFTALERLGYSVLEAADPEAALALVKAQPKGVDLVLTDVVMTGGGGAAVIRQISVVSPGVRILVMSGYNDDETLRRGIAQGEYPFIAKPFTVDTLARAVDNALRETAEPVQAPLR